MNPQAKLNLCSSCGSYVMLHVVPKRKFFKELPLSQELSYIKMLFKMHALHDADVHNILYNNRLKNNENRSKELNDH